MTNRKFTFNRGTWDAGNTIPGPLDGESNVQHLARIGYLTNGVCYGARYGGRLEVFESSRDDSFLALISPVGRTWSEVLIPDFQSYMLFIKDYGTSFGTTGSSAAQEVMMEILAKLFRAMHGHDWSERCCRCDP